MSSLDQAFIKAYQRSPAAAQTIQSYESAQPLVDPQTNPYAGPAPQLSVQDAWYGAGLRYRVDEPHLAADPATLPPYLHVPPQAYADLGYSSPYYAMPPHPPAAASGPHFAAAPPVTLPDPAPALVTDDVATSTPVARQAEPPAASAPDPKPASPAPHTAGRFEPPAQPSPEVTARQEPRPPEPRPPEGGRTATRERAAPRLDPETRDTLQTAAALKLPPPLELPSIFRGTDSPDPVAEEEAEKTFSPDWEVDHFAWPAICERLLEAEATYFRHVGERLLEATAKYPHVLMIAGCRRGEGRTTLALCLARCAAQAGVKVALLDADFKNPQLGPRLGMEIPCGWSEVLRGKAPLNEAAVASVADQLTLFPLTDTEPGDVEPGEAGLISLVQEISAHYPLVVVDVGPLGAEARHPFASDGVCPVNAAIVVRDLRFTTEKKAIATAQHLERSGIPAVGIAENFVQTRPMVLTSGSGSGD
jgi:Mrp family chromosome partitioning ATPase